MLYTEDRQRLHEGRHDTDAAQDATAITADTDYQAAIAKSCGTLATCRTALFDAAMNASREKGETDAERMKLRGAILDCVNWYDHIRDRATSTLLKPSPKTPVSASEIDRRRKLLDRVFRFAPSDVAAMATGSALEFFGGVAKALTDEPDLKPLGFAEDMTKAHQKAVDAAKELNREINEDSAATQALRNARSAFDRAAGGHALLVAGILKHEGKDGDIGKYVLARDPAYAARRVAGVPIEQEPGIEPVVEGQPAKEETPKPA